MQRWTEIANCPHDGGTLRRVGDVISCGTCSFQTPLAQGWLQLTPGTLPDSPPHFEGQIFNVQKEQSIGLVKALFRPAIINAGIPQDDLRVLEFGAGSGALTFGSVTNLQPRLYIASDVFPELVHLLSANIRDWGFDERVVLVGALDANRSTCLKRRVVNVIQGKSFLHHIEDYEEFVDRCAESLDSPGIMLFTEPFSEGFAYFLTISRFIRFMSEHTETINISQTLSSQLRFQDKSICRRLDMVASGAFSPDDYDDKHIFFRENLERLADRLRLKLRIYSEKRDMWRLIHGQFRIRGATDEDMEQIWPIIRNIVPDIVGQTCLSDMRHLITFTKE